MKQRTIERMRIAEYEIRSIVTGSLRLRTQASRGAGPFSLVDPHGRVEVVTRALLITGPGGNFVIDAGPGVRYTAVERETWGIVNAVDLAGGLRRAGVDPDSIDLLVLTHLHPDHAGGAFVEDGEAIRPALRRARVFLQESNLSLARRGGELDGYRSSEVVGFDGCDGILLDGPAEIAPGIRAFVTDGHTTGMQGIVIEGEGECLIAAADLFPTVSHLRLSGSCEHDRDPQRLDRERLDLFEEALTRDAWLFVYHDPRHVAIRLGGTPERPCVREERSF